MGVAPLAGAWIEIVTLAPGKHYETLSLPSRERGLKLSSALSSLVMAVVAPLAGAWIEIICRIQVRCAFVVAPLAGAWIEITKVSADRTSTSSLPSRERGLKFFYLMVVMV